MNKYEMTTRDLIASVVSGATFNVELATTQALFAAVIDDSGTNPVIRVSGISGSSGTGSAGTSGTSGTGFNGTTGSLTVTSGPIVVNGSSGTSGWFPMGESGNGISTADGIVTYVSLPTLVSGSSGISGTSGTSGGGGSSAYNVQDISDNVTTGGTFNYYRLSGVTSFYLPEPTGSGDWIMIKNVIGSNSTIYPVSGKIDGQTMKVLNLYDSYLFVDGSMGNWDVN